MTNEKILTWRLNQTNKSKKGSPHTSHDLHADCVRISQQLSSLIFFELCTFYVIKHSHSAVEFQALRCIN